MRWSAGRHDHRGFRVPRGHPSHTQGNGRRSIPLGGFGDDIFGREILRKRAHGGFLIRVGKDENVLCRNESFQPGKRGAEECFAAEKGQELLRSGFPAEGPKTLAAAACEDEDIKGRG